MGTIEPYNSWNHEENNVSPRAEILDEIPVSRNEAELQLLHEEFLDGARDLVDGQLPAKVRVMKEMKPETVSCAQSTSHIWYRFISINDGTWLDAGARHIGETLRVKPHRNSTQQVTSAVERKLRHSTQHHVGRCCRTQREN